jgi:hypothetical protein
MCSLENVCTCTGYVEMMSFEVSVAEEALDKRLGRKWKQKAAEESHLSRL